MTLEKTYYELIKQSRDLRQFVMLNNYINDYLREKEANGDFSQEERLFLLRCLEPLAPTQELIPPLIFRQYINEAEKDPLLSELWQIEFNKIQQHDELKAPFVKAMNAFNHGCKRREALINIWITILRALWHRLTFGIKTAKIILRSTRETSKESPQSVGHFLKRNPFVLTYFSRLVEEKKLTTQEKKMILIKLDPLVDTFGKIAPGFFQSIANDSEQPSFPEDVGQYCNNLPEPVRKLYINARTSFWHDAARDQSLDTPRMYRYWCVPVRCIMRLHELEHQFGIKGKS